MHDDDRNFRRRFLKASAAAAGVLALPGVARGQPKLESEVVFACFSPDALAAFRHAGVVA